MIHGHNTFELDDHPLDWQNTLDDLLFFRRCNPKFKASLFCVPDLMTRDRVEELRRHDWIRMLPHGFQHKPKECYGVEPAKMAMLDAIADDPRWGKCFKAPRYGYTSGFLQELAARNMSVAINTLNGIDQIPNMMSWDRRGWQLAAAAKHQHCYRHCRYPDGTAWGQKVINGRLTSLSSRFSLHYGRWLKRSARGPFRFVDELVRPARVRINIGCGPHYFADWLNLDHRPHGHDVVPWSWPAPMPCVECRAETVYSSHFLNYVPDHVAFFLEVWRVLRPGGVYRMEEDDTASGYTWRRTGQRHATGMIHSEPTRQGVVRALEQVGFEVREMPHDRTAASSPEVLGLHTRNRKHRQGHKFIIEATKRIAIKHFGRVYLDDSRRQRREEYPYRLPVAERAEP